ncbi:sugar ABC transporter permease [Kitasatospora sp. NPDC098652]|uniref:sugar ABC transporter permease n=1 Tax=Kitasatospora sp. NPDC098652 TaxID=3364095 RepID=UPI0038227E50
MTTPATNPHPKDPTTGNAGNPRAGDPRTTDAGDPTAAGEPRTTTAGDPTTGEPYATDPRTGEPRTTDAGDPHAPGPTTGAPTTTNPTTTNPTATDPRLHTPATTWAARTDTARRRLTTGDLGPLPVVIALAVIAIVFQSITHHFLQADNLTNITRFIAGPGLIAVGVVLVLILGEIDLSLGSVAGATSAIAAVLAVHQGWPEWLAITTALTAACAMGTLHGLLFARVGVPAFVVTLAGMLAWNGLQQWVLGDTGTINNHHNGIIAHLDTTFLGNGDTAYAWTLAILAPTLHLLTQLHTTRRRTAAGLPTRPLTHTLLRTTALAIPALATAYTLNQDRGLPLSLVILLTTILTTDLLLRRTPYGRHIYALGGNTEAARRAGINTTLTRTTTFLLSSLLAGLGGLFYASQQGTTDKQLGTGNTLMMAIAAAVIGGTSLFGGHGNAWTALLGILVIQTITTGLDMIHATQAIQYMITGTILLTAVTLDSLTRHTHPQHH